MVLCCGSPKKLIYHIFVYCRMRTVCAPSLFCFHIFPAKTEGHVSIFREAIVCNKGGISAFYALKSETKCPAHASSPASPISIRELLHWLGHRWCPRNVQEIRGLAPYHHFARNPTSKGLPICLALAPGIWKTCLLLLSSTSSCKEAFTSFVHPECLRALQGQEKGRKGPFSKLFAWRAPGGLIWQVLPSDFLSGDHGFGSGALG